MKKFIIRISLFCAILLALGILLNAIFPPSPTNYLREYDKKMTMLHTIKSPRIIFVGGSNVAFGLDSRMIRDSLGMNVINMGLHAGFGLKHMLDDVNSSVTPGDIIVIAPEYSHFFGIFEGGKEGTTLASMALIEGWPFIITLNPQQLTCLSNLPIVIKSNVIGNLQHRDHAPTDVYHIGAFNEYGDVEIHREGGKYNLDNMVALDGNLEPNAIDYVSQKIADWKRRGARVYLIPPATIVSYYERNRDKIEYLSSEMEKRGISFMVPPQRHVMPDSMAFDTPYHMADNGVRENTIRIIEDLQSKMGTGK